MSKVEEQFFETFGIEPIAYCEHGCSGANIPSQCKNCIYVDELKYPQITDRILLELICILTKRYDYADQNWLTKCDDTKELKVNVLRLLLLCTSSIIEKYKPQVQALFGENS